eukprot:403357827
MQSQGEQVKKSQTPGVTRASQINRDTFMSRSDQKRNSSSLISKDDQKSDQQGKSSEGKSQSQSLKEDTQEVMNPEIIVNVTNKKPTSIAAQKYEKKQQELRESEKMKDMIKQQQQLTAKLEALSKKQGSNKVKKLEDSDSERDTEVKKPNLNQKVAQSQEEEKNEQVLEEKKSQQVEEASPQTGNSYGRVLTPSNPFKNANIARKRGRPPKNSQLPNQSQERPQIKPSASKDKSQQNIKQIEEVQQKQQPEQPIQEQQNEESQSQEQEKTQRLTQKVKDCKIKRKAKKMCKRRSKMDSKEDSEYMYCISARKASGARTSKQKDDSKEEEKANYKNAQLQPLVNQDQDIEVQQDSDENQIKKKPDENARLSQEQDNSNSKEDSSQNDTQNSNNSITLEKRQPQNESQAEEAKNEVDDQLNKKIILCIKYLGQFSHEINKDKPNAGDNINRKKEIVNYINEREEKLKRVTQILLSNSLLIDTIRIIELKKYSQIIRKGADVTVYYNRKFKFLNELIDIGKQLSKKCRTLLKEKGRLSQCSDSSDDEQEQRRSRISKTENQNNQVVTQDKSAKQSKKKVVNEQEHKIEEEQVTGKRQLRPKKLDSQQVTIQNTLTQSKRSRVEDSEQESEESEPSEEEFKPRIKDSEYQLEKDQNIEMNDESTVKAKSSKKKTISQELNLKTEVKIEEEEKESQHDQEMEDSMHNDLHSEENIVVIKQEEQSEQEILKSSKKRNIKQLSKSKQYEQLSKSKHQRVDDFLHQQVLTQKKQATKSKLQQTIESSFSAALNHEFILTYTTRKIDQNGDIIEKSKETQSYTTNFNGEDANMFIQAQQLIYNLRH